MRKVTAYMRPEQDADGDWYVAGLGRFNFSSEDDAKSALALAVACEDQARKQILDAMQKCCAND